jgi:hypothetical protein
MKATKRKKTTKPIDMRASATFKLGGLTVTIDLDGPHGGVARQTAVEACRRMAHRLSGWAEVIKADPKAAATAEHMARFVSESDGELLPALRLKIARVTVKPC